MFFSLISAGSKFRADISRYLFTSGCRCTFVGKVFGPKIWVILLGSLLLSGGCNRPGQGRFVISPGTGPGSPADESTWSDGANGQSGPTGLYEAKEIKLNLDFKDAFYQRKDKSSIYGIFYVRNPINESQQTLIVHTFWRAQRGRTPYDDSCVNANIDLLSEVGDEKGLYRGAGFVTVKQHGEDEIEIAVKSCELQLADRTAGYQPLFVRGELSGSARLTRHAAKTELMLKDFYTEMEGF